MHFAGGEHWVYPPGSIPRDLSQIYLQIQIQMSFIGSEYTYVNMGFWHQ